MLSTAATTALVVATQRIQPTVPSHDLTGLVLIVAAALAVTGAGYLARCWLFPFTHCPHPHRASRHSTAWRCRRCEGTGQRLRAGRVFLNWLRDARGRARH